MVKARGQAERYARSLPASEPTPPFLIIVDVGHTFELFADFTQAGKAYLHFPDPRSFRIRLAQLADESIRERLKLIWTDPHALDPVRRSADVTLAVSGHLAELAKSLETAGHKPKAVADFLTRCLFCMFAEDVGLLPERSFTELLESIAPDGAGFPELLEQLFRELDSGTGKNISVVLRKKLMRFNGQTNYISTPGDFTAVSSMPVDHTQTSSYYLTDVEVQPATNGTAIVTFGDSITDGFRSTINANHRWPDDLAVLLAGASLTNIGVVDAGISGNRLLADDVGPSGLSRFDRDVLSQAGVAYVTVLLGVNDIGHSLTNTPITSDQLINGYLDLAGRAHAQGLKIFAGTLTPFGLSAYASPADEALREAANAFIRTNTAFDQYFDFDAALRDPQHPKQLLTNYDSGDHLHPNDAGYQAMAAAINLTNFQSGVVSAFHPSLSPSEAGGQTVNVSWSSAIPGFVLQETDSLAPPVVWQHSPLTPTLSNGLFSISIPATPGATRFFRVFTTP